MADAGQRLLDVIDDPNALESFLGCLTSDSGEAVDHVVESLARSLAAEYEVDSPSEALFDTLESSSNNLTDISQSNVPFDFDPVGNEHYGDPNGLGHHIGNGMSTNVSDQFQLDLNSSSAEMSNTSNLQHHEQYSSSSICDSNSSFIQQNLPSSTTANPSSSSLTYSSSASATFSQSQSDQLARLVQLQQQNSEFTSSTTGAGVSNSASNVISSSQTSTEVSNINSISVQQNHQISALSGNFQPGQVQVQVQQIDQQQQHTGSVFTTTSSDPNQQQSYVGLSQLVQRAQNHVLGQQLIATTSGTNIALNSPQVQNVQIQSASHPQQSFIIDSTGQTLVATGGGAFGGTNLALVSTGGGQPTYAVLPANSQLFSGNTITMQPQIQAVKSANGTTTYYQTSQPLMGAATTIQNQSPVNSTAPALIAVRPKQPPQLLPKPSTAGTSTSSTSSVSTTSSMSTTQSSTAVETNTNSGSTLTTTTLDTFSQILQQQQQQSSVANSGITISQPSFAFAQNASVVVSGVTNLNTMTAPQTLVLNHFGQQMIVPAGMSQSPGLQFILRQQPTQPQVLTIQAPNSAATIAQATTNGKQIVRYVSQMPQVAQNQTLQLQQIQTANGPQWVAVRLPTPNQTQPLTTTTTTQFAQIQSDSLSSQFQAVNNSVQNQINLNTVQQYQHQVQQQQHQQSIQPQAQQSQVNVTKQPDPISSISQTNESSSEPPPKKKPKKSSKKKKVVMLDLEQLLKQSGIMDEDLEDDGNSFFEDSFVQAMDPSTVPAHPIQNGIDSSQPHSTPVTPKKPNGSMKNTQTPVPPVPYQMVAHSHVLKPSPVTKQKAPPIPGAEPKKSPSKSKSRKKPPAAPVVEVKTEPRPVVQQQPTTPKAKPKAPPRNRSKKPPASITPAPIKIEPEVVLPPPPVLAKKSTPKKRSPPKKTPAAIKKEPSDSSNLTAAIFANSLVPGSTMASNATSSPSLSTTTPATTNNTRIVQTIQLTPQNQQLLRNIQLQINRLLSIKTRNETEQTALQKLIVLQQQVIASGTPVPNPSLVHTLAQAPGKGTVIGTTTINSAPASSSTNQKPLLPCVTSANASTNTTVQYVIQTTPKTLTQPPPLVPNNKLTPGVNAAAAMPTLMTNGQLKPETPTTNGHESTTPTAFVSTKKKPVVVVTPSTKEIKVELGATDEKVTSSSLSTTTTNTISTTTGYQQQYSSHPLGQIQIVVNDDDDYDEEEDSDEQRAARLKADEETRIKWRKDEFEKRIKEDQDLFLEPDYKSPFTSKGDAVDRLLRFHIARERTEMSFEEFDCDFADTACHLLDKFSGMVSKYRALLLKESMRDAECSERVMLERIFVGEEKLKLEHDRQQVSQGEILKLPPPPPSWVPRIQELVDAEIKEIERNSIVNEQVQSAIDSIITFGNNDVCVPDESEKVEYDAFGVPVSNSGYNNGMNSASSADIDEAVRSILA